MPRDAEDRELRLLGAQHAGVKRFHPGRELLAPRLPDQFEKTRLFGDVPIRVAGTGVRQHSHATLFRPIAKTGSGNRGQLLDNGGGVHLEEEILVRLLFLPEPAGFFLGFRSSAHGNENCAMRAGLLEGAVQALAVESHTVNLDQVGLKCVIVARKFKALRLARVEPWAAILGVPVPRPIGQLAGTTVENPSARVAEEPQKFLLRHIHAGQRVRDLDGFG